MKTIIKKTSELTEHEIQSFLNCHDNVFEGHGTTVDSFKCMYNNTCVGYSIISLLLDNNENVCGGMIAVPFYYDVNGEQLLFAFGSALMIKKEHRQGFTNLLTVMRSIFQGMKDNGVTVFFNFPNDNSDIVYQKLIRTKRIAMLDTYILPYKVGAYKKMAILNPFSMLFSKCMFGLAKCFNSKKTYSYPIAKSRPIFEDTRYQWRTGVYQHYKDDDMQCYWRITDFEGIKACFLAEVYPMSQRNFNKAVREMFKASHKECGLFLYVGLLPFKQYTMMKVPHKYEPKKFRFDVKILDPSKVNEEMILNVNNWEGDLSSYDLV